MQLWSMHAQPQLQNYVWTVSFFGLIIIFLHKTISFAQISRLATTSKETYLYNKVGQCCHK